LNDYILEIKNISKQFPGVKALSDVSIKVKRGKIHGLCGENGAGKSTLMKILSGVYPHGYYDGEILMNSRTLKNSSIREAFENGIAIVHQELALTPQMTVGENIYLGREPVRHRIINWHKLYADTKEILKKYGLDIPFSAKVSTLGVGRQQMVEIAKALSEDAKILILDEPTSALTGTEVNALMRILNTLKENGVTCIYITHKLEEFFRITDTITVLRDGMVVDTVDTASADTETLIAMMVGREMTERFPEGRRNPRKVIMEVKNLTAYDQVSRDKKALNNISFDVREGEILGIAGLMGAGRTELATTIFGEYGHRISGDIILDGKKITVKSARDAIDNRIHLVPEDRKGLGLIPMQSILKNISLPNIQRFSSIFRIDKHKELLECDKLARDMAIKCPSLHAEVNSLSGGNQQKVVISKWLMSRPRVLILDEPTRGIDVGAKYEIYKFINALAEDGVAIIMISSELPEILGMSDRILVMCHGECKGILDRRDATQEIIMTLATGTQTNRLN
jgi:D-xylose transport system ATP-binding protein